MTTDEAIAFAQERGFQVWSLSERTNGNWTARLCHKRITLEMSGKPGFNDGFTDYSEASTPAAAIIRAMGLRISRETGRTTEVEVVPFSLAAERKLETALQVAAEERQRPPIDRVAPDIIEALRSALQGATEARRKGRGRRRGW